MNEQVLGLITGVLFGFFLQKGRVLRFDKQISALLLKDMTIVKFMLSAIIVGMIGVYFLQDAGLIALNHKAMNLGATVVGGALFGLGWAVMGFCPGTSIGAIGEGRWHAIWAVAGMVTGAGLFAEVYPFFARTVLTWKDWGKISFVDVFCINHWIIIAFLITIYLAVFVLFEKRKI